MVSRANSEQCEKSCQWSIEEVRCVCVCVCMYMYVCVVYDDVSDTTKPRHDSTNPETGISYANLGPQTEK